LTRGAVRSILVLSGLNTSLNWSNCMKSIGSYEAKTNLSRLLDEVARGETITITKHGLPVALLVPIEPKDKSKAINLVEEIKSFKRIKLPKGTSIKDLIEEGRM